jgi:hypothetical protein
MGEQELHRSAVAAVRQRTTGRSEFNDPVDDRDGVVVERDHPLGLELAERHLQPGTLAGDLVDAVELEVAELADPDPSGAGEQQRIRSERLR